MRYCLTSDIHFKLSTYSPVFNEYTGIYYPIANLNLCAELVKKYDLDGIIILGDLFDRSLNSHLLIDKVVEYFIQLKDNLKDKSIIVLSGNHDVTSLKTEDMEYVYTTLKVLSSYVNLVLETNDYLIPNTVLIPHSHRKDILETNAFFGMNLLTHIGVTGFEVSSGVTITDEFQPEHLKNYEIVITGHYHKHNTNDNIYITGSPWPVRLNELYETKYIHIWDTETNKIKKIESIYPRLIQIILNTDKISSNELRKKLEESLSINPNSVFKFQIDHKFKHIYSIIEQLIQEFPGHVLYEFIINEKDNNKMHFENGNGKKEVINISFEMLLNDLLTEEQKKILIETDTLTLLLEEK